SVDPAAARAWLGEQGGSEARQLGTPELHPLLTAYGIPAIDSRVVKSADDAAAAAERLGFPVAVKIVSPDITHKTEVGGVALGLHDAGAVRDASAAMLARVAAARPQATIRGLLVEAMAPAGKELLLGGVRDSQWGPVLMVGLGGIYVEVMGDTTVCLAPVSPDEAATLLDELRIAPLLRGIRGERPVDRPALAAIISRFSQLLVDLPELREIEINPLLASPDGAIAVDARARLGA
ncbi:MAG TPA: acetate--CoA ligase family protein, partial [Methylomirabilota bacterium]|nr:acetate--CoA ligase family protein [Methylomirabilota bacterium]